MIATERRLGAVLVPSDSELGKHLSNFVCLADLAEFAQLNPDTYKPRCVNGLWRTLLRFDASQGGTLEVLHRESAKSLRAHLAQLSDRERTKALKSADDWMFEVSSLVALSHQLRNPGNQKMGGRGEWRLLVEWTCWMGLI